MRYYLSLLCTVLIHFSSFVFGMDPGEQEAYSCLPLHLACCSNNVDELSKLLTKNADMIHYDVNAPDKDGNTPLHIACMKDQEDCLDLLLGRPGIEVNRQNIHGETPFWIACDRGHSSLIKKLLKSADIDLNQANQGGLFGNSQPPLFLCCCHGDLSVIQQLMFHPRIDLGQEHNGGYYFEWIITSGAVDCLNWLLNSTFKESLIKTSDFSARIGNCFFDDVMDGVLCLDNEENHIELRVRIWRELVSSLDAHLLNTSEGFSKNENLLLSLCSKYSDIEYPKELLEILLEQEHLDINVSNLENFTAFDYLFHLNRGDLIKILLTSQNFEDNKNIIKQRLSARTKTFRIDMRGARMRNLLLKQVLNSFLVGGIKGLDVEIEPDERDSLSNNKIKRDKFVVRFTCCEKGPIYSVSIIMMHVERTDSLNIFFCSNCDSLFSLKTSKVGISASPRRWLQKRCVPEEGLPEAKRKKDS